MSCIEQRRKLLLAWLNANHISGKFHSIEQVVSSVHYEDGAPCYIYNTNPYIHDKCAVLSADVRALNWSVDEGCKIIIKDSKGGIKLCESIEEFNAWRNHELEPLDRAWKFLNNLKYKARLNDQEQLDLDNPSSDPKVVETIKKGE